ncbi:hypothetical protein GH714_010487 [Hevea brasiliensis]|uniref:Uncharacterized protein n=1 Tax=Hevea brasiliensis TaxID=3981 RepID=A0A6A6NGG0_HEVBR|nr:hypothetical protein GH714_010487 [Hevea brasiliensis]
MYRQRSSFIGLGWCGEFILANSDNQRQMRFDFARILVLTDSLEAINRFISIDIDKGIIKQRRKNRRISDLGLSPKLSGGAKFKKTCKKATKVMKPSDSDVSRMNRVHKKSLCLDKPSDLPLDPKKEARDTISIGKKLGLVFSEQDEVVA